MFTNMLFFFWCKKFLHCCKFKLSCTHQRLLNNIYWVLRYFIAVLNLFNQCVWIFFITNSWIPLKNLCLMFVATLLLCFFYTSVYKSHSTQIESVKGQWSVWMLMIWERKRFSLTAGWNFCAYQIGQIASWFVDKQDSFFFLIFSKLETVHNIYTW